MYVLGSHEQNTQDLADASQTARVDLADVDGLCLKQLLEHHPVVGVLAGRYADTEGLERLAHSGVSEDIVWRCGLLNEPAETVILLPQTM